MNRLAGTAFGRILALLLLAVVTAAAATTVVAPLWQMNNSLDDRIAVSRERLEAQRRLVASNANLEPRLAQLKAAYEGDRRYLRSPSDALAGAELQSTVKRVILSKGGSILTTQIVATERESGFTRVVLRVKMRASLEQTVEIFYSLETQSPYAFLDNVRLTNRFNSRRPTIPVASPAPPLDIEFDIAGYLRADMT